MSKLNFQNSERLLERALKVIPTGTQTFSKSMFQYPVGASPLYIESAKGCRVRDVDGNEFIDFTSALCPIILGYDDPYVNEAVIEQVHKGAIFTLPSPIEVEIAEIITGMVPCAEMVRFGKNGSDATSGAIRLSRAYTGRDRVACCGYHGWADWYIGVTPRNAGVPQAVRALTHPFKYNDIASLEKIFSDYPNQVACVIMEPMSDEWPKDRFLTKVKELTHKNGALLVFDEVITGFRFALGGAQELFGVIPDLACLGKAIANGYPLSAVVGKEEIMRYMEKIHFSFTFGGDCISLAAAKATLNQLKTKDILGKISRLGNRILKNQLVKGHPSRLFWMWPNDEFKYKVIQECIAEGILMIGYHNLTGAHTDADIDHLLNVYDKISRRIDSVILKAKPKESNFKIRWY